MGLNQFCQLTWKLGSLVSNSKDSWSFLSVSLENWSTHSTSTSGSYPDAIRVFPETVHFENWAHNFYANKYTLLCPRLTILLRNDMMTSYFFTLIPCTYASLPLDGTARSYYYFLSTWIRKSTQFVMSRSILFLPPYTRGEKKHIWYELESNPGPLASQATVLTTRPWLLGQVEIRNVNRL